MNNNLLLSLTESILSRDFCVATYYVSLPPGSDPYEKAKNMAVGQTCLLYTSPSPRDS